MELLPGLCSHATFLAGPQQGRARKSVPDLLTSDEVAPLAGRVLEFPHWPFLFKNE